LRMLSHFSFLPCLGLSQGKY